MSDDRTQVNANSRRIDKLEAKMRLIAQHLEDLADELGDIDKEDDDGIGDGGFGDPPSL